MVWVAFSQLGKTELVALERHQDFRKYTETLFNPLPPFSWRHYGTESVVQQDNAAIHMSATAKSF